MMRVGELLLNQSKKMLENKQYAIMYAVVLSVLPFASWLSVSLVAFVTLRKGAKSGFEVLLPALIFHSVPLMMLMSLDSAITNTLIAYIPCYSAAICLRKTVSWQAVFGVFLIQIFCAFLLISLLAPNFAVDQFDQFKKMLAHYEEYQHLIDNSTDGINSFNLAQMFFGIQILSVVISALISLIFARSIQAKLFMPGGLNAELIDFRSGRLAFLVLMGVSIASYYEISFAINLLPIILTYFLVSGFSLAYFILVRKWHVRMITLLLLLIMLKPMFMLFAYIVFGSLDSLFNFRLYLPARARESI